MKLFVTRILLILGVILTTPTNSFAQVFNTGPDNTSMFDSSFDVDTNLGAETFTLFFGNEDGSQDSTLQINVLPDGVLGGLFGGGTEVNVLGGLIDVQGNSFAGSEINLLAGDILGGFDVGDGSQANIFGGELGPFSRALSGSEINVRGGTIQSFRALSGSEINVRGGTFQSNIQAFDGSVVNLFGREFFLDGVSVFDSGPNTQIINDRDSTLSGLLSDGTPFSFELNSSDPLDSFSPDFFSPGATVSLTFAVPEPSSLTFLSLTGLLLLGRRRYS